MQLMTMTRLMDTKEKADRHPCRCAANAQNAKSRYLPLQIVLLIA